MIANFTHDDFLVGKFMHISVTDRQTERHLGIIKGRGILFPQETFCTEELPKYDNSNCMNWLIKMAFFISPMLSFHRGMQI